MKAIMTRRSIRSYTGRKVTEAQIKKLLEAAMNAPSACNQQAWQFVVVSDRETLTAITKIHPYAQMLKQASCAIVVCGDIKAEQCKDYWVQDCSAATQNILLAAHALGLGAVWLGVYPRMDRLKDLQKLLGMPKSIMPLSVISIGYPKIKAKPVKRYSAKKVHHDKW
ncbi:MAG: nitroreductase family protein [Candidatus Edwardsbacteria bacterium]|nr:nitroreductase family protein [Candidatus Edwardsbacteria bacterium]